LAKVLMKGNEALAEAAVRAGCRFFAGYPITPQSEILEYLSWRLPEVGGNFVQAESEIAAISMIYGAAAAGIRCMTGSSGPGISLKQEGISYIAAAELPAVIVDVMRFGSGLGLISPGQCDYLQATKGGGHGDYKLLVYAPESIQELADIVAVAFQKADEYRNPALILSDGALGQMMEPLELPPMQEIVVEKSWAVRGTNGKEPKFIQTPVYRDPNYVESMRNKYKLIAEKEQRAEKIYTDDAEVILVSYGMSARICRQAVEDGRKQGMKIGMIRAITLWPFPKKAFWEMGDQVKAYLTVEMNILGQMVEDVALSVKGRAPVYSLCSGKVPAKPEQILETVEGILNGTVEEVL
jgi:2-oxoglutarate ferredoxin oxidoreductase subunit alpha